MSMSYLEKCMKLQIICSANSVALIVHTEKKLNPYFLSFNGAIQFRIELFRFLYSDMHGMLI